MTHMFHLWLLTKDIKYFEYATKKTSFKMSHKLCCETSQYYLARHFVHRCEWGLKNAFSKASKQFCDKETKTHLIRAQNAILEIEFKESDSTGWSDLSPIARRQRRLVNKQAAVNELGWISTRKKKEKRKEKKREVRRRWMKALVLSLKIFISH